MTESDVSTFYPHLREVLDERFATLSDDELEEAFTETLGEGITPAEYEDFFGGLAKAVDRFAKQAIPTVAPIAQAAARGAAAGSLGGPMGAALGGTASGVGSILQQYGSGRLKGVGTGLGGVVQAAGALGGRNSDVKGIYGVLQALGQQGASKPAINALRGVLGRPETGAALSALLSGRNPAIPVGRALIPASRIAGLLGHLAKEAEAEAHDEADGSEAMMLPAHLFDEGNVPDDQTVMQALDAWLLREMALAALETDTWADRDEWEDTEDEDVWADSDDEDLLNAVDPLDAVGHFEEW